MPGAEISGLILPSRVGPLLLEEARMSLPRETVFPSFTFPTARILNAPAGSPTVPLPGPEFPLATTTWMSRSYTIASRKCSNPLFPLVDPPPKLRLMTSASSGLPKRDQSKACIASLQSMYPPPSVPFQPAFAFISLSMPYPGPLYTESILATIPATCVP